MILEVASDFNADDKQERGVFWARTTMTTPSVSRERTKGSEVERIGEVSMMTW